MTKPLTHPTVMPCFDKEVLMFIFERERERERERESELAGEGQKERETQTEAVPGPELSAQSLTQGSNSRTTRS